MSNWFANGTGIHLSPHHASFNRDQFGNLLKNAAPVAGMFMGGPLGAALVGGLGSAAGRGMQHGGNLGNILGQGVSGAGIATAGQGGMSALKSAFAPSSSAASLPSAVNDPLPGLARSTTAGAPPMAPFNSGIPNLETANTAVQHSASLPFRAIPDLIHGAGQQAAQQGGSMLGNAFRGVGGFVHDNPGPSMMIASSGLQGLGQMSQVGSENRLRNTEAAGLNTANDAAAYELQRRKAQDAALEPLRRALQGQLGQSFTPGQFTQYGGG